MSLNPVGYWRLNEPAFPVVVYPTGTATNLGSVGAAAHGTYIHSPVLQQSGALAGDANPSALFETVDQTVEIPYNPAFNPPGSFTVEFWANKTNDSTATASPLCNVGTDGSTFRYNGYLFWAGNADSRWWFRTYSGTTRSQVGSLSTIVPGAWTHVAGVHDSAGTGTNYLYIDGVLEATLENAGYAPQTGWPITVGSGPNDGEPLAYAFPGLLDELAIYPTALSATQIAEHYEAGMNPAPATPYSTLVETRDGAAGYWRFDEPLLPPKPGLPPAETAVNLGSLGSVANGVIEPAAGVTPGVDGVRYTGFESTNLACYFDGSGQIDCGNDPGFDFPTEISIAAWIKTDGVLNYMNILAKGGNLWRFNIRQTTPNLCWVFPGGDMTGTIPVTDGRWHHVVAVAGSGRAAIYVDGALDVSSGSTFNGSMNDHHVYIGSQGSVGSYRWKGSIDEVALFDTALTDAQVKELYDASQVPPVITQQPQAPAGPFYEGMTVSLSVAAIGDQPLSYQWIKNGAAIVGQTTTNLTMSSLVLNDSGDYAVVVTNRFGAVTSSAVALTVQVGPPVFGQKPVSLQRFAGGTATLTSAAYGSPPLSYQWSYNGIPISGATSFAYTINQVAAEDAGNYSVLVSNPYGNTNSENAALTVLAVTGYPADVMASGPTAYWRFNETTGVTAMDGAGGFDGTNVSLAYQNPGPSPDSTPTAFVGLESANTAYTFNNANASQVNLPSTFAMNRDAFSIVAWVRADTATPYLCIMAQGNIVWRFHLAQDAMSLELYTQGIGNDALQGSYPVVDGLWHQVAAVYDGVNKYLYVDGMLDAGPVAASGRVTDDGLPVMIGSQGGYRWNGDIDEVAFYNRGLSETEVANLYRAATAGPGAPQILVQPVSQAVFAGDPATFSVLVQGGAPYSYQWKHAGTNLPGATKRTLTIPNAYYTDAGTYSVSVTGAVPPSVNSQTASLTVTPPPLFANLTNDLVLHLKFDGDYLDSSGRNNHGASVGATTLVAGKIGSQALSYDTDASMAAYNYVTLGTPADLQFGAAVNFSVAFWVKQPAGALPGDLPFLCNAPNSANSFGYTFAPSWQDGGWQWTLNDGVNFGAAGAANSINDGNWHSLVFTVDRAGQGITYLDGTQVSSRAIDTLGSIDTGQPTNIGQDPTGAYGVSGSAVIDDMGVWHRVLSPMEVQTLYSVGQTYGRTFDTYGPVELTIQPAATGFDLIWQAGTLQECDSVNGAYLPVAGASAPYYHVTPGAAKKFYRVRL